MGLTSETITQRKGGRSFCIPRKTKHGIEDKRKYLIQLKEGKDKYWKCGQRDKDQDIASEYVSGIAREQLLQCESNMCRMIIRFTWHQTRNYDSTHQAVKG